MATGPVKSDDGDGDVRTPPGAGPTGRRTIASRSMFEGGAPIVTVETSENMAVGFRLHSVSPWQPFGLLDHAQKLPSQLTWSTIRHPRA